MPVPILAIAAVGLAAAGAATSYSASKKTASANQSIAGEEQKQEAVRKQAAELDARRRQLEIIRNQQRARSLALSRGVAQGAGVDSTGVLGGYGQIAGDTGTNILGVTQNLGLANQLFASNSNISGYRGQIAGYQSQASLGQGLSSLGGALMSSIGPLTAMSQGFGSSTPKYGGYTPGPVASANSAFGRGGLY